jgi:hypothetical protein
MSTNQLRKGKIMGCITSTNSDDLGDFNIDHSKVLPEKDTVSNSNIYDMLVEIAHSVEESRKYNETQFSIIDRRLKSVEEQLSTIVSAIAISPQLRSNAIRDVNTGQNTRVVMSRVPCVLFSVLWKQTYPDVPFPVTTTYLTKLISAINTDYPQLVRSQLGSVFSVVISSSETILLQGLSALFSDSASEYSSQMRSNIMHICCSLRTIYAFLIPEPLCTFLHRIKDIYNTGTISFCTTNVKPTGSDVPISPGKVYVRMGESWLSKPMIMKVINEEKSRRSRKYYMNLCTTLYNGNIPTSEDLGNLDIDIGVDAMSLLDIDTKRDGTKDNMSVYSSSSSRVIAGSIISSNKKDMTKAKSLFRVTIKK